MHDVRPRILPLLVAAQFLLLGSALRAADDVKLTKLADRVRVDIGGAHFTDYIYGDGASRPYVYPLTAPDGTSLSRDFPMKKTEGEETDHPWHRSLWFAHSFMNNVDFWNEGSGDAGKSPPNKGRSEHQAFVDTKDGKVGIISTRNRWVGPDGKLICTDERTVKFHANADGRMIDFEITLHALPDAPLLMGDNKDGTFATRLAQWMTMPHAGNVKDADGKTVKKEVGGTGHIVTATGEKDEAAWGKRADWCDYHADRNGKTYGIAIFDHPQNLRHPTWWMARNYGLFGANPFGWHDYEKEFAKEPHKGDYTIPAGGSLTLKYRVFLHLGDEVAAHVGAQYAAYAAGK
jgi:hypothetical protein